jgi:DNA helicase-2/ATP-dependent DNA helicase PcrA
MYRNLLDKRGIPHRELLRNSVETSGVARVLGSTLNYLSNPSSPNGLENLFKNWKRKALGDEGEVVQVMYTQICETLLKTPKVEEFLYPFAEDVDCLVRFRKENPEPEGGEKFFTVLDEFRTIVCRCLEAKSLSIDQLILTIAQEMLRDPEDLATALQMANVLQQEVNRDPSVSLFALSKIMAEIMQEKRPLSGVGNADMNFQPQDYQGEILVATMHKAKGLEWDQVYLTGLNNYHFPFDLAKDPVHDKYNFVLGNLNLGEECIGQLKSLLNIGEYDEYYVEGEPTRKAQTREAEDKLRLFYVGITRAKRGLQLSYNVGDYSKNCASEIFKELMNWWEENYDLTRGNSVQPVYD